MGKQLTDDFLKWTLEVDGKPTQAALAELSNKTNDLKNANKLLTVELQKMKAAGEDNTDAFKDLQNQYNTNKTTISQMEDKMRDLRKEIGIGSLSIKDLSKYMSDLKNQMRNMDPNSAQFKTLSADLEVAKSRMQELNGNQSITNKLYGEFKTLLPAVGIAVGIYKVFSEAVDSNRLIHEKLGIAIAGAKEAVSFFLKSLVSGNLENFKDRLKEVVAQAVEYQKVIYDLENRTRSYTIAQAKEENAIKLLEVQARNQNLSDKERLAIYEQIKNKREALANELSDIETTRLDERIKLMAKESGLEVKQVENLIQNYNAMKPTLELAEKYNEALATYNHLKSVSQTGTFTYKAAGTDEQIAEAKKDLDAVTAQGGASASKLLAKYGTQTKAQLDEVAGMWVNAIHATGQAQSEGMRDLSKENALSFKANKEGLDKKLIDQEKYQQDVLKLGMGAIDKENYEYTQRLEKAGLFNINYRNLTKEEKAALEALEVDHWGKLAKIQNDANAKEIAGMTIQYEDLSKTMKEWDAQAATDKALEYEKEQLALTQKYDQGLLDEDQYQKQKQAITDRNNLEKLNAELASLESQKALANLYHQSTLDIDKQIGNKQVQIVSATNTAIINKNKDRTKAEKDEQKKRIDIYESAANEMGALLGDSIFNAETSLAEFSKQTILLVLDTLKKIAMLSESEAMIKAIASGNPVQIAGVVLKYALIEAAFAAAKSAVSHFLTPPKPSAKQLYEGQYEVTGAQDGKSYSVPFAGAMRTGYYPRPVLVAERGGEMVIDNPTYRNIMASQPNLISQILNHRVNQYAEGNYPSGNSDTNRLMINAISELKNQMDILNNRLANPIEANVSLLGKRGFYAKQAELDFIQNNTRL